MQLAPLASAYLMCRELCHRTHLVTEGVVLSIALLPYVALHAAGEQEADALVQQLSGLPAELASGAFSQLCNPAPSPCPPPRLPTDEARRQSIYDQLFVLGDASVPALARALGSQDASLRSNAALALGVLGEDGGHRLIAPKQRSILAPRCRRSRLLCKIQRRHRGARRASY
jgi:hypothetical protein